MAYGNPLQDREIHLLDVRSLHQRRITHCGRPPTISSVSVDALIDGWSPDSRRLLFNVARGDDTSEEGDLAVPQAPYGFYEYDVASRKTMPVELPKSFEFVAWLKDGRFVGVLPGRLPAGDKLVIMRPDGTRQISVTAIDASPYLAQLSADGNWLVGLHAESGRLPGKGTAQIVKVELANMAVTPLATLNSWSGNERPSLSPDDKHVAYKRENPNHPLYHIPQESLVVDRRQIYSCPGPIDYKWVNKRMIALACQNEVIVLDVNTGKTLSSYRLAAPRAHH